MKYLIEQFPAATNRDKILIAGFMEMYQNGYQGMRIEAILKTTGLAKGALYHHFPNKLALAYAIVDEILFEHSKQHFESRLSQFDDPLEAHCQILREMGENISDEEIALGCPLNNLSQEMSALDEGFNARLCNIFNHWIEQVSDSIQRGKAQGIVRPDVDSNRTALFIISAHEGIIGTSKCMQSKEIFTELTEALCDYIENLRLTTTTG